MKILAFLPEFEAKVAKFNKKAAKWNLPLITYQVTEEGVEERAVGVDEEGRAIMIKVEYVKLEIQGDVPRLAGWSIHSKVQPSDIAGQNYVFTTPGHELKEGLRVQPLYCDHCQSRRLKKNAYWIVHEDGRQMMVGATCLKDFLPSVDVESLIAYMNKIAELSGDDEFDGDIPAQWHVYYTDRAIMDAYVSIKQCGFVSKSKSEETGTPPTSSDINPGRKREAEMYKGIDMDNLRVELSGFIPHMLAKSSVGNDFIHNVQLALQSEICRPKLFGYIAAAVMVWMKDLADAREAQQSASEHQGTVGARLDLKGLRITRLTVSEGAYGYTYIYGLADEKGNKFTWFASRNIGEIDAVVNLTGTVKKHDEFRGTKQTVLTRCRVY
jgi:hypothetical protein